MQRTFDVDDVDVYSFLTGDVSEAFNCLFIFDTFNETVNAYDLDSYGNDTNIFVNTRNLAENINILQKLIRNRVLAVSIRIHINGL